MSEPQSKNGSRQMREVQQKFRKLACNSDMREERGSCTPSTADENDYCIGEIARLSAGNYANSVHANLPAIAFAIINQSPQEICEEEAASYSCESASPGKIHETNYSKQL